MKPHIKLKTPHGTIAPTAEQLSSQIAVLSHFGMSGFGGWLPNPDPILRKMGRQIDVYRELLRDPLVGGQVRRRKAAVARLQWRLDGDDVPTNVRDTIQAALESHDLDRLIKDILNATLFGYQPIEIIWQRGSLWLPERIIAKPPEWFGFDDDAQLYFHQNGASREPLPAYKFLCPTQEASYANPYGLGDLGLVFWAVTFKRAGLKFWAEFTQKYGSPWLIGKEPRSNTDADTNKLLDALEALVGNAVGTIPNDSSVEIHEASGKAASVDAYDKLIRYCRSEINIALLGQDQTTEANTNHASATAGLEVTDDIRDSDKRIVETTFNQLIEWVVEINFGDVARPKFVLFENEESGTRERAERDKMMVDAGAKFTNQYWQRTYGLEDGDLADEVQPTQEGRSADFAEFDLTDAGLVIDGLAPDTGILNKQGERLTAVLVAELRQGETAENLLDRLSAAYPNMDDTALQNELARLIFLSDLVGRIEVVQELKS